MAGVWSFTARKAIEKNAAKGNAARLLGSANNPDAP
jgi:hypothetical protein